MTRLRLQQALLSGAVTAVPHRLGVSLTALSQSDDEVCVKFNDGSSGRYDLVVGADGIHSTVRQLAVASSEPIYAGQMAWRSVIPTRPAGMIEMMVLLGEGCFFGLVPMGEGCTYGFGAVDGQRFEDPLAGRLESALPTDDSRITASKVDDAAFREKAPFDVPDGLPRRREYVEDVRPMA